MIEDTLVFAVVLLCLGVVTEILVRMAERMRILVALHDLLRRVPYVIALLGVFLTTWSPSQAPQLARIDLILVCLLGEFFHEMVLAHLRFAGPWRMLVFIYRRWASFGVWTRDRRELRNDSIRRDRSGFGRIKSSHRNNLRKP